MIQAPARSEAAEYYFRYIDQVPAGDICETLAAQLPEAINMFQSISEQRSLHRYAPEKWSIREVLGHVNDTERLFVFRALWFARGFDSPLPSFDQTVAMAAAAAGARPWASHVEEFAALREATVGFFRGLPEAAWDRQGTASGKSFTVRALAYLTAGHLAHHATILKERYLT